MMNHTDSRPSWRYGRTTSADLARHLDAVATRSNLQTEIRELVIGTFGTDEDGQR